MDTSGDQSDEKQGAEKRVGVEEQRTIALNFIISDRTSEK